MEGVEINEDTGVATISAYCFRCENQGTAVVATVDFPYFENLVVSSFNCEHCGYSDRRIECLMDPKPNGIHHELKVTKKSDLNRTIVRQFSAVVAIPEIEFELKPFCTDGNLVTVELFLLRCIEGFDHILKEQDQDSESYSKIMSIRQQLKEMKNYERPFTLILDDPSGNSFIECPNLPDPEIWSLEYMRTWDEDIKIGIYEHEDQPVTQDKSGTVDQKSSQQLDEENDKTVKMAHICTKCHRPAHISLQKVDVPHFQQVFLSSTVCESCGYHSSELMECGMIDTN
ncbi:Zinc finger protein ZPR1 [Thelohanellus kitauei]|uniref:Zinc finger protein ZPR1 n=1 Tax=Thelohanellus kitauei TaxID=669202 RepID=A0A0C2MPJ1_THEKT|nr:Zinc finger protein ZPR1 [Thelohanellus kitauei]